ncbi:hypothetical protein P9112_010448 [Eukaryota sp. TZLM1-RC]
MRILDKSEEIEADVTFEDQTNICEYSRLNHHRVDLKEELDKISKEIESLKSAQDDLELVMPEDDTPIYVHVGTSFIVSSEDDAESFISAELRRVSAKAQEKQEQYNSVVERMKILREALYAKFKSTINLEIDY